MGVSGDKRWQCQASDCEVEFPGEIESIMHTCVHALCSFGRVSVCSLPCCQLLSQDCEMTVQHTSPVMNTFSSASVK